MESLDFPPAGGATIVDGGFQNKTTHYAYLVGVDWLRREGFPPGLAISGSYRSLSVILFVDTLASSFSSKSWCHGTFINWIIIASFHHFSRLLTPLSYLEIIFVTSNSIHPLAQTQLHLWRASLKWLFHWFFCSCCCFSTVPATIELKTSRYSTGCPLQQGVIRLAWIMIILLLLDNHVLAEFWIIVFFKKRLSNFSFDLIYRFPPSNSSLPRPPHTMITRAIMNGPYLLLL